MLSCVIPSLTFNFLLMYRLTQTRMFLQTYDFNLSPDTTVDTLPAGQEG